MIHSVRETGRKLKVRSADRLRVHFLALGRRLVSWRQSAGFGNENGVAIGVTSADPRSGRTTVAFNIAAALANLGNGPVLFIETENSSNGFAKKVPRPGYGFSEVLSGTQPPSSCICNTNIENLYVMSCGRIHSKDALGLPVESMTSICPELSSTFDFVIYDLPVANDTNLCFPMAEYLDGVLIVNDANIQEKKAQRVVKRFRDIGTSVIGIVLNKT